MAFKSLLAGAGQCSRRNYRGKRVSEDQLAVTVYTNKTKAVGTKTIAFYVGVNLAKRARLIAGDKIDIEKDDESGLGIIKRTNEPHGRTLGTTANKQKYYRITSSFLAQYFPHIDKLVVLEGVEVADEGIVFVWPK